MLFIIYTKEILMFFLSNHCFSATITFFRVTITFFGKRSITLCRAITHTVFCDWIKSGSRQANGGQTYGRPCTFLNIYQSKRGILRTRFCGLSVLAS